MHFIFPEISTSTAKNQIVFLPPTSYLLFFNSILHGGAAMMNLKLEQILHDIRFNKNHSFSLHYCLIP